MEQRFTLTTEEAEDSVLMTISISWEAIEELLGRPYQDHGSDDETLAELAVVEGHTWAADADEMGMDANGWQLSAWLDELPAKASH